MDINEIKMTILEESGWTIKDLNEAAEALVKLDILYTNQELAYRTIARELSISLKTEYSGQQQSSESRTPDPFLTIETARDELEDGEYFTAVVKCLGAFRAPRPTIGFMPIGDATAIVDLKFFADQHHMGSQFEAGKTYRIEGIQNGVNDQYGWGLSIAKYSTVTEVEDDVVPPVTKIEDLKDGFDTFVIEGMLENVNETGIDLGFCKECNKYAGTYRQISETEGDHFCEKCQEVTELFYARPLSGRIMDSTGSVDIGFPLDFPKEEQLNGLRAVVSGTYQKEKNKLYLKALLKKVSRKHNYEGVLDKFIKKNGKKKKKSKKKDTVKVRTSFEQFTDHINLNSKTWAAGSMTKDVLLDNGKVFDITEKNINEFLDIALTNGDLFSPKKGFYMIG